VIERLAIKLYTDYHKVPLKRQANDRWWAFAKRLSNCLFFEHGCQTI